MWLDSIPSGAYTVITAEGVSPYRVQVIADSSGMYRGNGLTFETADLAEDYATDLYARWTLVSSWRVVDATGTVVRES